jgi:TonB family protein
VLSLSVAGQQEPRLLIRKSPGAETAGLTLVDPSWKESTFGRDSDSVEAVLEPGSVTTRGGSFYRSSEYNIRGLHLTATGYDYLDRLAEAKSVSARRSGTEIAQIRLPAAARAVAALRACEDEALAAWKIDVALWRALRSPPKAVEPALNLFRHTDYPDEAIRREAQGRATVKLNIEADGRATSCDVLTSAGHWALDKQTCDVALKRGRFTPALDSAGKPIAAPYVLSIRWVLPAG